MNQKIYIISIIIIFSCGTHKVKKTNSLINSKPNVEYKKSVKSFYGKLDNKEYKKIIDTLKKELNIKLFKSTPILINYRQKAQNCILREDNRNSKSRDIDIIIRMSSRISKEHNTIDYFVYTNDSRQKELYQTKNNFILDSGFFYKNIFTTHENCRAFYILKPNGEFMIHYGGDYFSEVVKFLKAK